jgi:DNA sulfur modification protein DndE
MKLSKVRLSKEASSRLRFLAGRTGLPPNLLCRIGFCLSLAEPVLAKADEHLEEDREFNRYTLLGEYDEFFVALLKERMSAESGSGNLETMFKAHMNRGVVLLQQRLKSLDQLCELVIRNAGRQ